MASFVFHPQRGGVVNVEIAEADRKEGETYPRMSVVHRLHFENWDAPAGAYVLVDPIPSLEGKYSVYAGEATKSGVSGRLKEHVRNPRAGLETWMLAVAVHGQQVDEKEPRITYDEAQALEFFLVKELRKSNFVKLENTVDPSEVPLLTETRDKLMKFVGYVIELLRAYGCDVKDKSNERVVEKAYAGYKDRFNRPDPPPASSSQSPTSSDPPPPGTPSVAALISAGLLNVGTKLISGWHMYPCEAEIADRQGNIQVLRYGRDDQGNWLHNLSGDPDFRFKTPSGASSVIVTIGGAQSNANGWTFWRLADDQKVSLRDLNMKLADNDLQKIESVKPKRTRGTPKFSSVTLADLISAGRISVGTKLVSKHQKYPCEAEIADRQGSIQVLRYGKDDQGKWLHELSGDSAFRFPTPSGATSIIVTFGDANSDANGWTFWMLKSQPTKSLRDIRTEHERSG